MGAEKKSKKERQATRKAQNTRYRDTKAAAGLKLVSVWVPIEALDRVAGCKKVGLVVVDEGQDCPPLIVRKKGKKWEVIERQGQLLEKPA